MRWRLHILVAAGLAAGLSGPLAATEGAAQYTYVQWTQGDGTLVPLENVFAKLRKQYTGDPIGNVAKRDGGGGVLLYEVKWLTNDGRKLVFLVDARSGGVVSTRGAN